MEAKTSLLQRVNDAAELRIASSGKEYRGIPRGSVEAIVSVTGISVREVEIAALKSGIVPLRYQRNVGSLGLEGQLKLRMARVAVVGAGGLGGTIIELLARLGLGALVVIDGDTFTEDNLNRQLLCTEEWIGKSKVEAARRRVTQLNPSVEVIAHQLFINPDNVDSLIKGCCLVVDALDSIPMRLILQESASRLDIPFVHGAVAGFIGQIMTVCPGDRGLKAFYGDDPSAPRSGIEIELGTPTPTPMVTATLQVMEVVKLITGRGEIARNRLLCLDLDRDVVSGLDLAPPNTPQEPLS
jgi:molybdopterin/thiamine biosynthesis adenylyltransferase